MANKINDYTLDIGWDSNKAIQGIDKLENKIRNLGDVSARMADPMSGGKRGRVAYDGERKRIELLRNTLAQTRSLSNEAQNIPKGERFNAQRQALARNLVELRKFRDNLRKTRFRTQADANAMAESFIMLTDKVQKTRAASMRLRKTLSMKDKVVRGVKSSFIAGTVATMGFYAAIKAVRAGLNNMKEFENLDIQMQAAFGSSTAGAERLQFVQKVANDLGSPIMALAKNYAQLGTAARMSGLTVKEGEDIFLAAAEAAKVFGMSQEQTDGVIRAFTQMIGKQQVMAEELKLQLGDRFPPAMGLFAKSMGISVKELTKMMELGQVTTEHLKQFSATLRQDVRDSGALAKAIQSVDSATQRLGNRVKLASAEMTKGWFSKAYVGLINQISNFVRDLTPFLDMLGDLMGLLLGVFNVLLTVVLKPLGMVLKSIGELYQSIKGIALTDRKDIDNLSTMEKIARAIFGVFYDIYLTAMDISWNANKFLSAGNGEPMEILQQNRTMAAFDEYKRANSPSKGSTSKTTITNNVKIDGTTPPNVVDDILSSMGLDPISSLPSGAS